MPNVNAPVPSAILTSELRRASIPSQQILGSSMNYEARWRVLRPSPDSAGAVKLMLINVRFPAMPAIARIQFIWQNCTQVLRHRLSIRINPPASVKFVPHVTPT